MKELIIGVVGVLAAFIIGGTMVKNDAITISPTIGNTGNTETAQPATQMSYQPSEQLGATPGPEHYNKEYFYGGLVQGGGLLTATAGVTVTWTAANVCDNSVIKWIPTATSLLSTTTIPTAATLIDRCLPKIGDFKDIVFINAGANTTNTVAFTMGTYVTAFIPEATGANQIVAGLNYAKIRFLRTTATSVAMFIDEGLVQ